LKSVVIAVGVWLALAAGADAAVTYRDALEQVTRADGYRYTVRDDHGRSMDTLKILRRGDKEYLGVYHTLAGGRFEVHVATSRDLVKWRHRARLSVNASQPTVARRPGGRYLVAYEKDSGCRSGNNCLGFRRYDTDRKLLNGRPRGKLARERAPHRAHVLQVRGGDAELLPRHKALVRSRVPLLPGLPRGSAGARNL
jgi:hypothetical protein